MDATTSVSLKHCADLEASESFAWMIGKMRESADKEADAALRRAETAQDAWEAILRYRAMQKLIALPGVEFEGARALIKQLEQA